MPPLCRLHLVAPDMPPADALACFAAACDAGDVASMVVPLAMLAPLTAAARARDVALIVTNDLQSARDADGVEVAIAEACREAHRLYGTSRIVGGRAGASRHLAMELAEAGADYIAFEPHATFGDDPIIAWWADLFEIPCIAADPVEPSDIATLLTQRPDFIRPSDTMWRSADDSRRIIEETMHAIAGTK